MLPFHILTVLTITLFSSFEFDRLYKVEILHFFFLFRWIIKARVTNKSNIRTWANSRGEGKLFSIDLVDESGEIRLTGFKDMVDKFFDYIQVFIW